MEIIVSFFFRKNNIWSLIIPRTCHVYLTVSDATDCTSDKITVSVDQIKNGKTGANLPSTFADGDTYTVVCKYPDTQVFTNQVRGQSGV